MDHAGPDRDGFALARGQPSGPRGEDAAGQRLPPLHGLFLQRHPGDDALLKLAALRFAQAGLAAEAYADTPEQLERVLQFAPPHPRLPTVHLNRALNLLEPRDLAAVEEFGARFAGRVSGLVVHDQAGMQSDLAALVAAARRLDARLGELPGAPHVFVEYAANAEPDWFAAAARQLQFAERVSVCVDVGHLGIRQACARFSNRRPGVDLRSLSLSDPRLPDLADDVDGAVAGALADVLEVTRAIGGLGKHVHFHLHDGHPLVGGLADHFSFLTRLPVPFGHDGRRSLNTLYGPAGLAEIVAAATAACGPGRVSFTLEIHQVEGRLPLADAAGLFSHWRDTANAERANHWLAVLSQNAMLVESAISQARAPGLPGGP